MSSGDAGSLALPESAFKSALNPEVGAWSFEDNEVAKRFDREALCHIPGKFL